MQAATVLINCRALRHNLQRLRELAPASKLVVVVKANACGHGLTETARALPDTGALGVTRLRETLRLRAGDIMRPTLLLEGLFKTDDLPTISVEHLRTAAHNEEQFVALENTEFKGPVTVWMKLDTRMHRLSVLPKQAEAFYQRLNRRKSIRQPMNIVSHLARTDRPQSGTTEKQLDIFNTFCGGKPGQRSIAASGSILLWSQSHFDWARPEIILYGVSPLKDGTTGAGFGCQPATLLTSSLIAVREHRARELTGYDKTWVSERDTRLGVVAMGYGDSYPRATSSGMPVLVNGREVPIVRRVAMDMICVDLGPQVQDKVGSLVILWGEGLPTEHIAETTKINVYELITCPTSRVAMKHVD